MVPLSDLIDTRPKPFYRRGWFMILVIGIALFSIAYSGYLATERDYISSGGMIYSWKGYACIDGVMYRTGRAYTLMVNQDGSPKRCDIVKMTNYEFEIKLSPN